MACDHRNAFLVHFYDCYNCIACSTNSWINTISTSVNSWVKTLFRLANSWVSTISGSVQVFSTQRGHTWNHSCYSTNSVKMQRIWHCTAVWFCVHVCESLTWSVSMSVACFLNTATDFAGKVQVHRKATAGSVCQIAVQLPQVSVLSTLFEFFKVFYEWIIFM